MEILSKKSFQTQVLDRVKALKVPHMEAVLLVCEKYDLDPLDVKRYVDDTLKERLRVEAEKLNCLKEKSTTLTLDVD